LFDQYTIYSKIGNGGMGVVYLARDRRIGRFVAIKRLNSQAQSIPSLRQRFLHEARAVATLSHVHIVHIYALGEDEDGPFIVMEYVAGRTRPTSRTRPVRVVWCSRIRLSRSTSTCRGTASSPPMRRSISC
jgi:serine/threonine-protein kinase